MGNIFKGSSHGIREVQYRHHDQTTGEPSRNSDSLSDFDEENIDLAMALSLAEEEDIGLAMALSLAEEEEKGKNVPENEFHLDQEAKALEEEDEQDDKASQESVNVDSPPQSPPDDDRRRCADCKGEISDNEYFKSDNRSYHKSCYMELYYPKCDVCKNFIPTTNAAVRNEVECGGHRYWSQKYCPSHNHDGTPRCCSCERMVPMEPRYSSLEDGRKLCLECSDSAIMDTHKLEQLHLEIQEFFEGLNMKVERQIPLLLVERQALNEAMEGEKGHHHMPETRGLCLFEPQIVNAISSPRIGSYDQIMDLFTEPYTLVSECEVTAILVLYGLPRLLTGSILAHEMMHAWLRLNGYPTLSPNVEEGICQVLAHEWLASEILAGSAKIGKWSESEKKLGEFFLHQIKSEPSPAYGDGFREGNKAVIKYGLKSTLDHILLTGCFP